MVYLDGVIIHLITFDDHLSDIVQFLISLSLYDVGLKTT
jgi:hypothetical protein